MKPVFLLMAFAMASVCCAEDQPASAETALREAKNVLLLGQKGLVNAEAERLARVVAAIDAMLALQGEPPAIDEKINPKDLKKIIKAKFATKGECGDEISLLYSNWSANDLADWVATGPDPVVSKNGLTLAPGSTLTHKVRFQSSVRVGGEIALSNKTGTHLGSTGGLNVGVTCYNTWLVGAKWGGSDIGQAVYDNRYMLTDGSKDWIPFVLSLQKGVFTLSWKDQKLGAAATDNFGYLILKGGTGGNTFRNVSIAGILDRAWLQETLEQAEVDAALATPDKRK